MIRIYASFEEKSTILYTLTLIQFSQISMNTIQNIYVHRSIHFGGKRIVNQFIIEGRSYRHCVVHRNVGNNPFLQKRHTLNYLCLQNLQHDNM